MVEARRGQRVVSFKKLLFYLGIQLINDVMLVSGVQQSDLVIYIYYIYMYIIPTPWASQIVLVVKNLPANAGDIRDAG